jgi:2-oxoglutarate dehydrogenase E2 component (dihydrolipoamide succinyltransferase)
MGTVLAYIGEPNEQPGEGPAVRDAGERPKIEAAVSHANGGAGQSVTESVSASGVTRAPFPARVSPVVARMAAEHELDLSRIAGSGRDGRVTKRDVLAFLEKQERVGPTPVAASAAVEPAAPPIITPPSPRPTVPAPAAPAPAAHRPVAIPGELLPMTNIRRAIAEHMVRSKHTSPHVTTVFEVDFSVAMAHREANKVAYEHDGARLTLTAYIVAAIARALKAHPMVNSSWSDEGIVLKREVNVGMAAAVAQGLIVPVIKGADGLNLLGLARKINDLTERARANRLLPDDVQGGTFTLTNHGTSGSLFATPIINQPQCGILGVGKVQKRVVVIEEMIAIRPMAYVSLTFDHRILDGASADAFVTTFKDLIEGWQ